MEDITEAFIRSARTAFAEMEADDLRDTLARNVSAAFAGAERGRALHSRITDTVAQMSAHRTAVAARYGLPWNELAGRMNGRMYSRASWRAWPDGQ